MDPHTLLLAQIRMIQAKNPHDRIFDEMAPWLPSPEEVGETGVDPIPYLDKCLPHAGENGIRHIAELVMDWRRRQRDGERIKRELMSAGDGLRKSVEGEIILHFKTWGTLIQQGEIVQRVPTWKGLEARIVRHYLQDRHLPAWRVYCRQVIEAYPWP